jgi:hypothetical protein
VLGCKPGDDIELSEQNRVADSFLDDHAGSADDLGLLTLGEHNALRIANRTVDDAAHDSPRPTESFLEPLPIVLEIDHFPRGTAAHRGPGDSWSNPEQNARIEWKRDEIVGTELYRAETVKA